MNIAFSPCPNDTFVFHALIHGYIPDTPQFKVTYADIDKTNSWAEGSTDLDILKVSYAALPWMSPEYKLLPCGGALGRGCGPLVLTSSNAIPASRTAPSASSLTGKRVAVPSERSTAYMLFRLWAAQNVPDGVGEILVMPFHEIMPAVRDGLIDAGLVIHEARFTYPQYGLSMLVDLGSWWETDTGLPIPLGAIIAKRNLELGAITQWIQASVKYAWKHPEASQAYIMEHAQEMDPQVAQSHIQLYVNEFTENLGEDGYAAVTTLLKRAMEEGLIPIVNLEALR